VFFGAKRFLFCHKGTKAQRKNNKYILGVLVPNVFSADLSILEGNSLIMELTDFLPLEKWKELEKK
jgi:hypothetical protein